MSYTLLLYHIIFRTKNSVPALSIEHESLLYRYIWRLVKNKNSVLYRIGGMPDHIHLLPALHPSLSISDFMRTLKTSTNTWLKENWQKFPLFRGWRTGYAAFTYGFSEKETIIRYIDNQKKTP